MAKEFHDLAETALNHESGGATCWGNLGYWTPGASYPQACAALADQLAMRLALNSATRLVDVGFGCGDQLLHWLQHYQVHRLRGLNLSRSQTELARERLRQAGHTDLAAHIQQGDVADLRTWFAAAPSFPAPDILLALDCAYHFRSRQRFIRDAAQVLAPGGRLGMTDIILARAGLGWREQAALRLIAALSHLPWCNLQTEAAYRATWENEGFEVLSLDDVTDHVFEPFGDWLIRYKAALDPGIAARVRWGKYDATAKFLRWAARKRILRYVVCVGRQRSTSASSPAP